MYSYLMSRTTNPTAAADPDFLAQVGRGDPTILYNITGYGLTGLFFEIQTKTRFPINFNWEISVAWVRTLHKQNLGWGKRSGFFSRNSKVRLPQTDAI